MSAHPVPYWRLSSLYFFYFTLVGALVPYWGLYLEQRGFDGVEIGLIMAVMSATKIGAPNLWGWLADRTGRHALIIQLGTATCGVCFVGVFLEPAFIGLLLVITLYSFFWNAVLPQYEVITLHALRGQTERYSLVRVWGSIGFIVFVVGLGFAFDYLSVRWLPGIVLALIACLFLVSLLAPDERIETRSGERLPFMDYLRSPVVLAFFAAAFLAQMAHGAYYAFFTLYMESHDYSRGMIGGLWAVGVIAEVIMFLYMHRVLVRWDARTLLLASFVIGVVRWLVVAWFPDSLPAILVVQLGHAATFAIIHSVAIQFVHQRFPASVAGQGQALYSAVSFGAGGAVGNLSAGWLWDHVSHSAPFLMAAAASLAAALIVFWLFKPRVTE